MKHIETLKTVQEHLSYEDVFLPLDSLGYLGEAITNGKQKILDMLGGRWVIEKDTPSEITVDDNIKQMGIDELFRYITNELPYFSNVYILRRFFRECGYEAFYQNKVPNDMNFPGYSTDGERSTIKIPQGMKVSRAMKLFVYDKQTLNKIQIKYSQIINTSSITGRMGLSIHPMDFLTMSTNNNNWRSCMALDGEYSVGTVSYALDPFTFMVYLKSDTDNVQLEGVPQGIKWNSKKWRCLFYFDTEYKVITASKQYPYTSPALLQEAMEMIIKEFHLENWEIKILDSLYDENIIVGSKGLIYNDLLHINKKYNIIIDKEKLSEYKVEPGEEITCPQCGEAHLDYGGSFVCSSCANRTICENCCHPISTADEEYYVDGMTVCEGCFMDCCAFCEECGEAHWIDDGSLIFLEDVVLCESCYEILYEEEDEDYGEY
jgi:hypothetical protein